MTIRNKFYKISYIVQRGILQKWVSKIQWQVFTDNKKWDIYNSTIVSKVTPDVINCKVIK